MKKAFSVIALVVAFLGISGARAATPINVPFRILPAGTAGQSYNFKLTAVGGVAPYVFSFNAGTLPAGLSLASDGTISGQIAGNGTEFTVKITDSLGTPAVSGAIILPVRGAGSSQVLGVNTYANGSLVNDSGTVYIIYKNAKIGFANPAAFLNLGYSWKNVVYGDTAELPTLRMILDGSVTVHPSGSWISYGKTVYFVTDNGLIPVPSYAIFLNNGGNPKFIVPANSTDLAGTQLPVMTNSDSRMQ